MSRTCVAFPVTRAGPKAHVWDGVDYLWVTLYSHFLSCKDYMSFLPGCHSGSGLGVLLCSSQTPKYVFPTFLQLRSRVLQDDGTSLTASPSPPQSLLLPSADMLDSESGAGYVVSGIAHTRQWLLGSTFSVFFVLHLPFNLISQIPEERSYVLKF